MPLHRRSPADRHRGQPVGCAHRHARGAGRGVPSHDAANLHRAPDNSLDYASWKDRKALAAAIKPIYTAPSAEAAQAELDAFEHGQWGAKFPTVVASWRRAWDRVIPFFAFPPEVRRVIYTTNAIESLNARLRKIIKTRGTSPATARPPSWPPSQGRPLNPRPRQSIGVRSPNSRRRRLPSTEPTSDARPTLARKKKTTRSHVRRVLKAEPGTPLASATASRWRTCQKGQSACANICMCQGISS